MQGRARLFLPPVVAGEVHRLQHAEEPAIARMLADDDVLQRVQMRHQPHILEGTGDAVIDPTARRHVGDVLAVDMDRSAIDRIDAGNEIEHRSLAGAVRSDQGRARAAADFESEIVDHGKAAELLGDVSELQDVRRAHAAPRFCADLPNGSRQSNRRRSIPPVISPCGRSAISTMMPAANTT